MSLAVKLVQVLVLVFFLSSAAASADAMPVSQLTLTGGSIELDLGFFGTVEKSFSTQGVLVMGQYQPLPDIFPSVTKGNKTFSLFTSGVQGNAAPSATINGSQITVDLNSLFLGVSKGDSLKAWKIGGTAIGSFNSQTSSFDIAWDRLFKNKPFVQGATFTLQGTAQVAAIPLPATLTMFGFGLAALVTML
ncbi:MAG: hypothetical protein ACT4OO_03290, partial [Nitrospiraceae bacterium]